MLEVEASRLLAECAKFASTRHGVSWSLFRRIGASAIHKRGSQSTRTIMLMIYYQIR